MRPVNLLPERMRPRTGGGGGPRVYIALGVLGLLVLAVTVLVLSGNGVNAKRSELARLTAEADQAESQSAGLGPFQGFAQIKQQRLQSVRGLADARFDWERLARELAHVLPADVWVTKLEASLLPAGSGPVAEESAGQGPSLKLSGCAPDQETVAVTLLRLRRLHRATDVKLTESSKPETQAPEPGTAAPASPAPAAGTTGGCAPVRGKPTYKFDVSVEFSAAAAAPVPGTRTRAVPAALGGGS